MGTTRMDRAPRARQAPGQSPPDRRRPDAGQAGTASILDLQCSAGNAAVAQLLAVGRRPDPTDPLPLQRDLAAYNEAHDQNAGTVTIKRTVDAPALARALNALVQARRLKRSYDDDLTVYSVAAVGVTKEEIEAPLAAAGFAKASEMAAALLDDRDIKVYTAETVISLHQMFGGETPIRTDKDELRTPDARPLTATEWAAAKAVFGSAIQLEGVKISFGGLMSAGDTARTIPDHIYFPKGYVSMGWLIHELTHVWQYQEDEASADIIEDALLASYDYGGEWYLAEAWASGKSFSHFNHEQQGDILQHYYERVVRDGGHFDSAVPFVEQVRNGTWRGPRDLEKERREKEERARRTATPPVPGPAPNLTPLVEAGLEGLIKMELERRIKPDDVPALAGRKKTLLELFGRFSQPSALELLRRIRERPPGDELVRLLYRRVSRGTRAEVVGTLTAMSAATGRGS